MPYGLPSYLSEAIADYESCEITLRQSTDQGI